MIFLRFFCCFFALFRSGVIQGCVTVHLDGADAAVLDLRDVDEAVDALLDGGEGAVALDRVDLRRDELLLVGGLELGEVGLKEKN